MRKNTNRGLGKLIYMEWIIPVRDYYCSIRRNEIIFELVIPFTIAISCTLLYLKKGNYFIALDGLAELLPTAISILIGFTVMLITLLLTSSGESVERLKNIETGKILYKAPVTLYQGLHIQFAHSLFSEIMLLLLIFFYLFLSGLGIPSLVGVIILLVEIHLTLNILFSILRGITSLYFSFYGAKKEQ